MKYKFIGTEQDLIDNGFSLCDENNLNYSEWDLTMNDTYIYELGYSRKGQFYYYFIDLKSENKVIQVYATKPDGDGTSVDLNIGLIKNLIDKGLVVEV